MSAEAPPLSEETVAELAKLIDIAEADAPRCLDAYSSATRWGRLAMRLTDRSTYETGRRELEYQEAQRSIVEARRSAERIEGQIVIWR